MSSQEHHPQSQGISEDETPGPGKPGLEKKGRAKPPHRDTVRRTLAFGVLVLTGIAVVIGGIGYLKGDDISSWSTFCGPLFTLAGVALPFSLTRSDKKTR